MAEPKSQSEALLRDYIPALRFHALTPLYDITMRILLREKRFRSLILQHADLIPGQRILDFGCGTGTLTLMLKQACPKATVVGLDIDRHVLSIAQAKANSNDLDISFNLGSVADPPHTMEIAPESFDWIISSLVFHHLSNENKYRALDAAHTLLKPGGRLLIADWGKPANIMMRTAFLSVQLLDGFTTTAANVRGHLPEMIREAGFDDVTVGPRLNTVLGSLVLNQARKAG